MQVDTGQRLNAQLQVFGAVRWLAAGNLSTREIFARHTSEKCSAVKAWKPWRRCSGACWTRLW